MKIYAVLSGLLLIFFSFTVEAISASSITPEAKIEHACWLMAEYGVDELSPDTPKDIIDGFRDNAIEDCVALITQAKGNQKVAQQNYLKLYKSRKKSLIEAIAGTYSGSKEANAKAINIAVGLIAGHKRVLTEAAYAATHRDYLQKMTVAMDKATNEVINN
ncbi:hypothetical protein OS580_001468 [Escherichia coli]|nr:hypothetical protein [Escherichia coli]